MGGRRPLDAARPRLVEEALFAPTSARLRWPRPWRCCAHGRRHRRGWSRGDAGGSQRGGEVGRWTGARASPRFSTRPWVVFVVGVNGAGKTTTIGKLAQAWKREGRRCCVCAADTFRAAAIEQLEVWAGARGRGVPPRRRGRRPAAVVSDALQAARGPRHRRADRRHRGPAPHQGQPDGGARQDGARGRPRGRGRAARGAAGAGRHRGRTASPRRACSTRPAGVTGLVLTKLDGTAKGGVAVAVVRELGVPIRSSGWARRSRTCCPSTPRPSPPPSWASSVRGRGDPALDDEAWMRRALALAARGLGETNPNPAVGCVVARRRARRGRGLPRAGRAGPTPRSRRCGRPAPRARGATLYVTLEPCAHHGRTPPCAPLVARVGRARASWRPSRPEPARGRTRASRSCAAPGSRSRRGPRGGGARASTSASSCRRGRPALVLLKAALTLDGRIATASGRSQWITGPRRARARPAGSGAARRRPRRDRHRARRRPAAPAVAPHAAARSRVVLDSRLRLPPGAGSPARPRADARRSCSSCAHGPAAPAARSEARGVEVVDVAAEGGRVSLRGPRGALARAA